MSFFSLSNIRNGQKLKKLRKLLFVSVFVSAFVMGSFLPNFLSSSPIGDNTENESFAFRSASASPMEVPTPIVSNLIMRYILNDNPSLSESEAFKLANVVILHSYEYGLDPLVMTSLISAESTFHEGSYSGAGAIGYGQLMPDTARALGVNPYDPYENILGACSYLATQLRNFSSYPVPMEIALAAYNAGPNAVKKYGGIPPYSETINYVERIKNQYYGLYRDLMFDLNAEPGFGFTSSYSSSNNGSDMEEEDDITNGYGDAQRHHYSSSGGTTNVVERDYHNYIQYKERGDRRNNVMYSTEDDFEYL